LFALIAHPGDQVAAAVATALARRVDRREILALSAEELMLSARWRHALTDEDVSTHIRLASGRQLDTASLDAVLNRIRYVQPPLFRRPTDRSYAVMELFALLLSWLASLRCPVVNAASPRGLAGAERSQPEWLRLAAAAGLRTRRLRLTSNGRRFARDGFSAHPSTAIPLELGLALHPAVPTGRRPAVYAEPIQSARRIAVVGERVFGAPSAEWEPHCVGLARLADCALLEVRAARGSGPGSSWLVTGASAFPEELSEEEAAALADLLVASARTAGP
jgi:hypothetical protein